MKVADDKPEAYVKTSALDGERNLKPKLANPLIGEAFDQFFGPSGEQSKVNLSVKCISPQKELYYFNGRLTASLPSEPDFKMELDLNQFLHRGSYIENSGYVYCLVVYTGVDTKLMLNMGSYVFKQSQYERILNKIMICNLIIALIIAVVSAIFGTAFAKKYEDKYTYFYDESFDSGSIYIILLIRFYLLVNSFVPLDLLATMEISKVRILPRLEDDCEMMCVEKSSGEILQFKANTGVLTEELAQVEYIFCDKTGTLTQNELVFRAMILQKG